MGDTKKVQINGKNFTSVESNSLTREVLGDTQPYKCELCSGLCNYLQAQSHFCKPNKCRSGKVVFQQLSPELYVCQECYSEVFYLSIETHAAGHSVTSNEFARIAKDIFAVCSKSTCSTKEDFLSYLESLEAELPDFSECSKKVFRVENSVEEWYKVKNSSYYVY